MVKPRAAISRRRSPLALAGAACATALAGCARYNANNGGIERVLV